MSQRERIDCKLYRLHGVFRRRKKNDIFFLLISGKRIVFAFLMTFVNDIFISCPSKFAARICTKCENNFSCYSASSRDDRHRQLFVLFFNVMIVHGPGIALYILYVFNMIIIFRKIRAVRSIVNGAYTSHQYQTYVFRANCPK